MGELFMELENKNIKQECKGDIRMELLAKPGNTLPVIPVENSREFLEEANKNCLSLEFLSQCKESSNMFNFID